MRNTQLSAAGLIAGVVLAAVTLMVGPVHAAWIPAIASAVVLLAIFVYDRAPARTFPQSLAYAAACGFLLLSFAIFPVYQFVPGMAAAASAVVTQPWLPAIWLAGSLVFLAIDRFRLGSKPVVLEMNAPRVQTPAVQPPVIQPAPVAKPAPTPEPPVSVVAAVAAAAAPAVPVPEPIQPVSLPPAPVEVLKPVEVKAMPVKGTPATIYLNLVGTGIACLRAVKAEHLGRDFYKITEEIPRGEAWEFQTGQIVRCRKKTLSSGKAMVAYEEAPRAS